MKSFPLCFVYWATNEIEGLQRDVRVQKSLLGSWFVLVIFVVEVFILSSGALVCKYSFMFNVFCILTLKWRRF